MKKLLLILLLLFSSIAYSNFAIVPFCGISELNLNENGEWTIELYYQFYNETFDSLFIESFFSI